MLTKTLIEQTDLILETLPNLFETFVDKRGAAINEEPNQPKRNLKTKLEKMKKTQTTCKTPPLKNGFQNSITN
jgi:hypothetical protein